MRPQPPVTFSPAGEIANGETTVSSRIYNIDWLRTNNFRVASRHGVRPMRFLRCLAHAVVSNGLKALASGIPFVGGLIEIADDAWKHYREQPARNAPPPEAALSAEVEALAQAPAAQVRQQVAEAVQEAAADQPAAVQAALTAYLTQVPAMIRRSLPRPSDPSGTTLAANRGPRKPADLLPFLPAKLPRFKPGDRPLPGVNWELEELLGVGGFGEVWKAHHPTLTNITAALKFCLDAEAGKTLRHEASTLNRVMQAGRHAGIVPLRQAYLDSEPICLEYEYVEGGDLGALIQELHQHGPVKPEEAARWMLHLAGTVRFAHQMQPPLVHRDLKPANILVQRSLEGKFSLRVADFGISAVAASQALDEAARTPTNRNSLLPTAVRGAYTPLYASPQQIYKGEPADPRRRACPGRHLVSDAHWRPEPGIARRLARRTGRTRCARPHERPAGPLCRGAFRAPPPQCHRTGPATECPAPGEREASALC